MHGCRCKTHTFVGVGAHNSSFELKPRFGHTDNTTLKRQGSQVALRYLELWDDD